MRRIVWQPAAERRAYRGGIGNRFTARAAVLLPLAILTCLLSPGLAGAHLSVLRPSPSDAVTFRGHGGYSSDGGYPGGVVRAEVPVGSSVVHAYLYGTYEGASPLSSQSRTINFDGTNVVMEEIESNRNILPSTRADVTQQVAAKVGTGGLVSFGIDSNPSGAALFQGAALVVIYSNPSSPLVSVAVLDGAASSAGDTATLNFAYALDTNAPGFRATMAIGDGFSYQGEGPSSHKCGPEQQDSTIKIDEQLMTSCAGGYDDSPTTQFLISVGGIGDSIDDPANPATTTEGTEDELYDLRPFLHNGDTQMTINTANASGDDDVFLAVIAITPNVSVGVGTESPPPPPRAEPPEAGTAPSIGAPADPAEGGPLVGRQGIFPGAESFAYQWQLCATADPTSCTDIAGAKGINYTPGPADVGGFLRLVVTAKNANGSTVGSSAVVGPIAVLLRSAAAPAAPATPVAPATVSAPQVCKSQRQESIHWRVARKVHLSRIRIALNGKTLRMLGGKVRQTNVSLVGRGKGTVQVLIMGTTRKGHRYSAIRTYEPCVPSDGGHRLRSGNLNGRR
jgi:hypothetical protein